MSKHKLIVRSEEPRAAADCSCGRWASAASGVGGLERIRVSHLEHCLEQLEAENKELLEALEDLMRLYYSEDDPSEMEVGHAFAQAEEAIAKAKGA